MSRAAGIESSLTRNRAGKLFASQNAMANKAFFLDFSVNTFDYLGGILSYICLAPLILHGKYNDKDAGELTEVIQEIFKIHFGSIRKRPGIWTKKCLLPVCRNIINSQGYIEAN